MFAVPDGPLTENEKTPKADAWGFSRFRCRLGKKSYSAEHIGK
jgi:hypothetical protein